MAGLVRIPETLVDYQLFADGYGLLGEAIDVKLPTIQEIYESVDLPGAATSQKNFLGMFEELDAEFTLLGLNPHVLGLYGQDEILFTLRAASHQSGRAVPVIPLVFYMTGRLYAMDTDEIAKKNMTRTRCKLDVAHYKVVHGGSNIVEIAADGSVVKFDGRDVRSLINAAIGNPAGIVNGLIS